MNPTSPALKGHLSTLLLATLAASAPSLLAYNVSPSPTFLNQALALALWGWFVLSAVPPARTPGRGALPLFWAAAGIGAAVLWSWGPGSLPLGLAASALGLMGAAVVMAAAGSGVHSRPDGAATAADFCTGWWAAGLFNVVLALVQVFAPGWCDGNWIAETSYVGRAVGNLRQPNHLSSLLTWAAIASVALLEFRRLDRRIVVPSFVLLVFAIVLTASRTGLVSMALLAVWGVADRRLSRPARLLLLSAPLVYAIGWLGMAEWAKLAHATFGGATRLSAEGDISSSRFAIWSNTLAMIRQQPWTGVGWGEFNFAWTLTPFPQRPVAFFDHAHNLPLHLLVELGIPLGGAVLVALLAALGLAAVRAWSERDEGPSVGRRAAFMMVLTIGLHSLLEYPLWYSYFLLPAAWAWAYAMGRPQRKALPGAAAHSSGLTVAALVLVGGSVLAVLDYLPVTEIFRAGDDLRPLGQRIERGQRSVFFAHHADYAAATIQPPAAPMVPFEVATHFLLDTRLMMAWSRALEAHGRSNDARFLAERLREFRNPGADEFFAACGKPRAGASAPFQCVHSERQPDWREFVRP